MVVPMKKVRVYALKSDREALLQALQRHSLVMLTETEGAVQDIAAEQTQQKLEEAGAALQFANRRRQKKSLFAQPEQVSYSALVGADADGDMLILEKKTSDVAAEIAAAQKQQESLRANIQSLRVWRGLGFALGDIADTRHTRAITGTLPRAEADSLALNDASAVFGEGDILGPTVVVFCHRDAFAATMESLKDAGFSEAAPPDYKRTAEQEIAAFEHEIASLDNLLAALEDEALELAKDAAQLELLSDSLSAEKARREAPYGETESVFYLEGWLPEERWGKLESVVEKAAPYSAIEPVEPAEGEQPPTLTKNNRFITPFESITDMYSRPDPHGVDPNPVMGPWYWIIFGMMMGDVGYGLLMLLLFGAFKFLKKPKGDFGKLVDILLFSSVTTIFWGIMFGACFGEEFFPPVLLVPLDNPVTMLLICMVLGALHIFTGMIVKMVMLIKDGHWLDALFDQLSWILLIIGLGLLFVWPTVGMVLAIIGGATILLTAGRNNKGFGKVTGGLLGLYNITSYLSDIISYARILALILSSGVIAMVMNLLAGMVSGGVLGWFFAILIYIVGHVFNLAMGLLSAYVHTSRLQYIEFFGKFYEGGGHEFKPLSTGAKYVDVNTDPNE